MSLDRVVRGMGALLLSGLAGMGIGLVTGAAVGAIFFGVGAIFGAIAGLIAGFPTGVLGALFWSRWGWVFSGMIGAATGGFMLGRVMNVFENAWASGSFWFYAAIFILLPAVGGGIAGNNTGRNLDNYTGTFFQQWSCWMDKLSYSELSATERILSLLLLTSTAWGIYLLVSATF